ncbi:MAG: hypothetical protein P1P69_00175 [Methanosarcinaceae archaeon]|nr:hypothetical protein [Methanosarcinaceae archaeon]
MNEIEIMDKDSLRKTALLIPIAVIIGTLNAILAYMFLPPTSAMGLILATCIIVTYVIFRKPNKD